MPGHLGTDGGQQGERIGPEDLHGEGMIEPGLLGPPELGHDVGQRPVDVHQGPDTQGLAHVSCSSPRVHMCLPHCLCESADRSE